MRNNMNRVKRVSYDHQDAQPVTTSKTQHKRSTTLIFILALVILLISTYIWSVNRVSSEHIKILDKRIIDVHNGNDIVSTNHIWVAEFDNKLIGSKTDLTVEASVFDTYTIGQSLDVLLKNGHVVEVEK